MTRFLIWTAPFLSVAAPAFAQQADPATGAASAAAPVKPKKICRTFQVTGRRIAETECHTAEQWAAYDRANNETATQFVNGATHTGNPGTLNTGSNGALSTNSIFGLGPQ